jgi:glycosyltransferase involved in cell wall biosynthesis
MPAHNAAATIDSQLQALFEQDAPTLASVVVVDSCSDDDLQSVLSRWRTRWPKVQGARVDRPGANLARNVGVRRTATDVVLFCDADDIVGSSWIRELTAALAKYDIVRGRLETRRLNSPEVRAMRGEIASRHTPLPDRPVSGLGGNCGVRRLAWDQLGGFSERYALGANDQEFWYRAHLAGLRVGYASDAVVHYRLPESPAALRRQLTRRSIGTALLYREFRQSGIVGRRPLAKALSSWVWTGIHVRDQWSSSPAKVGRWTRAYARNLGNLRGSVAHRVWFP